MRRGRDFYTETRTCKAFRMHYHVGGDAGFCIGRSDRYGGRTEFRKDISTPGRAYYITNKVRDAYKTTAPKDSATLHLPSDRDAYWGCCAGVGEKG